MANFRSYTATQIIYKGLRHLGVLRPAGVQSADTNNDLLSELNDMVDAWEIDRRKIWAIRPDLYTLTPDVQFYLIGPGAVPAVIGGVQYGAFDTARPKEIENANLVINSVIPTIRKEIDVLNADQWADIAVQQIPSALPEQLWYDRGFNSSGIGTIRLWPGPLLNYQLELFTTQGIAQLLAFADLVTAYSFPPGYADAVVFSFAERAGPMMRIYSKLPAELYEANLTDVKRQAKIARENIESYNAPSVFMQVDPAFSSGRGGAFDYSLGTTRGTRG